ncbi:MAG: hypothetical protein ACT4PU_02290 [Planctomycetota bacterium]
MLVGLALLVGGFAFFAGPDDADGAVASLPAAEAPTERVSFAAISPKDKRKAVNLESAKREIERIKRDGEQVNETTYKLIDENGIETFYHTELIPGIGRNGEPLYLTAQMIRTETMANVKPKLAPKDKMPKLANKMIKGGFSGGKDGKAGAPRVTDLPKKKKSGDGGESESGAGASGEGSSSGDGSGGQAPAGDSGGDKGKKQGGKQGSAAPQSGGG